MPASASIEAGYVHLARKKDYYNYSGHGFDTDKLYLKHHRNEKKNAGYWNKSGTLSLKVGGILTIYVFQKKKAFSNQFLVAGSR